MHEELVSISLSEYCCLWMLFGIFIGTVIGCLVGVIVTKNIEAT